MDSDHGLSSSLFFILFANLPNVGFSCKALGEADWRALGPAKGVTSGLVGWRLLLAGCHRSSLPYLEAWLHEPNLNAEVFNETPKSPLGLVEAEAVGAALRA